MIYVQRNVVPVAGGGESVGCCTCCFAVGTVGVLAVVEV